LLLAAFAVVIVAVTFALNARPSGGEAEPPVPSPTPLTAPSPPAGVPASAMPVLAPYDAGTTAVIAPERLRRLFFRLECRDDLLVVATTRETIYATLDCSDYGVNFDAWEPLLAQPVHVRVEPGEPYRLSVEAASAAAYFEADAAWIAEFR
jgi:hypothetical protein